MNFMNPVNRLMCATVLLLCASTGEAAADYQADKDKRNLGIVERAVAKFRKNPQLFDGRAIVAGSPAGKVNQHATACNGVIRTFNKYFGRLSKRGMRTPRALAVYREVRALNPWCKALTAANAAYLDKARAAARVASANRAARKGMCRSLRRDASKAVGRLHEVLDTWSGGRTPATADHVKAFRQQLTKLGLVCGNPKYKDAVTSCDRLGILSSSDTNKRYDYGDICAPAADPKKTLTEVAMRMIQSSQRHGARKPMTVKRLEFQEGWLHQTRPIRYKSHFTVTQDKKDALVASTKAAFAAAGVEPPADLSVLWANQQAYLDTVKSAVDATAGKWKIHHGRCKGYPCRLARRRIKKDHRRASIKAVHGKRWTIVKNALGIPLRRYYGMMVVYKLPGEPYCQVRSLTAYETYRGGGRFQRAKVLEPGYVRFQRSCR